MSTAALPPEARESEIRYSVVVANQPVRDFDMTLKQKILAFLMDPNMAFVLLAIGLLSLYIEFNHPGAIVPGVVGFFFVVLAVFALNILPVRYAALALIVLLKPKRSNLRPVAMSKLIASPMFGVWPWIPTSASLRSRKHHTRSCGWSCTSIRPAAAASPSATCAATRWSN